MPRDSPAHPPTGALGVRSLPQLGSRSDPTTSHCLWLLLVTLQQGRGQAGPPGLRVPMGTPEAALAEGL